MTELPAAPAAEAAGRAHPFRVMTGEVNFQMLGGSSERRNR
jgi:hypothetical protein